MTCMDYEENTKIAQINVERLRRVKTEILEKMFRDVDVLIIKKETHVPENNTKQLKPLL